MGKLGVIMAGNSNRASQSNRREAAEGGGFHVGKG